MCLTEYFARIFLDFRLQFVLSIFLCRPLSVFVAAFLHSFCFFVCTCPSGYFNCVLIRRVFLWMQVLQAFCCALFFSFSFLGFLLFHCLSSITFSSTCLFVTVLLDRSHLFYSLCCFHFFLSFVFCLIHLFLLKPSMYLKAAINERLS